jgi:hypothetical protein
VVSSKHSSSSSVAFTLYGPRQYKVICVISELIIESFCDIASYIVILFKITSGCFVGFVSTKTLFSEMGLRLLAVTIYY